MTMEKVNFPEADRDITQYVLASICAKLWWQMVTMAKVNFPEADRDITYEICFVKNTASLSLAFVTSLEGSCRAGRCLLVLNELVRLTAVNCFSSASSLSAMTSSSTQTRHSTVSITSPLFITCGILT